MTCLGAAGSQAHFAGHSSDDVQGRPFDSALRKRFFGLSRVGPQGWAVEVRSADIRGWLTRPLDPGLSDLRSDRQLGAVCLCAACARAMPSGLGSQRFTLATTIRLPAMCPWKQSSGWHGCAVLIQTTW
jgi:hypothetical protein